MSCTAMMHRQWRAPSPGRPPHARYWALGFLRAGSLRRAAKKFQKSAEQSSNNDKGDVENTFQVPAELKKQQREPPFKAPQMDAPVQYTVLAEIPATNPADAHSTKKFGLHQPRPSPESPLSVTGSSTTATTPHRVLLRATPSTTCTAKIPCVAPTASTACTTEAIPMVSIAIRRGASPPPFPRGWCYEVLLRPCCI
jgi:hypothetical protein